jgi:hypothetical protein
LRGRPGFDRISTGTPAMLSGIGPGLFVIMYL